MAPKTGHGCRTPEQWGATIAWLLDQKRVADADRISLVVHTLRHNRIRWVAVLQQSTYGKASTVEARRGRQVVIDTDNVRRLAVGPIPDVTRIEVRLDGSDVGEFDLTREQQFVRSASGQWSISDRPVSTDQKRPGLSGPRRRATGCGRARSCR